MDMLVRDQLTRVKFQGVREHRLVFDARIAAGQEQAGAWQGLGELVYLADASLVAHGQTGLHEHRTVDVVTVLLEGRIRHEGSLESGRSLAAWDVQVQCAGDQGFSHNEVNPDDSANRMIQLWVLPGQAGSEAAYRGYQLAEGCVTRVYGGPAGRSDSLPAETCIDIARLRSGQSLDIDKPSLS